MTDVKIFTEDELSAMSDSELLEQLEYYSTQATIFDSIQNAIKINLNSCFGTMGNEYFAWYKKAQAEAITLSAQTATQTVFDSIDAYMLKHFNKSDTSVIYSDTDSILLACDIIAKLEPNESFETKVDRIAKFVSGDILTEINKDLEKMAKFLNCKKNKMSLKLESICDKAILFAKKRYAINTVYDENGFRKIPKRKVVGVEIVRSETPKLSRKRLSGIIDLMFDGTQAEVYKELTEVRDAFDEALPQEISVNKSCSDMKKWVDSSGSFKSGAPIQSKAATAYNRLRKTFKVEDKYEAIREGDKMKYVYLKIPNPSGYEVMGFSTELPTEFGLDNYIDRKTMFDKTYKAPVERLVEFIGWNTVKKNTVDDDLFGF